MKKKVEDHKGLVYLLLISLFSRILIIFLGTVSDFILDDYDSSNIILTKVLSSSSTILPYSPFNKWDGVYFSYISRFGYDYDLFHAFFPMVPALIRYLPIGLGFVVPLVFFVVSTFFFYKLSCTIFGSGEKRFIYLACIIYILTPSGVFMSAIYTESIFSCFSMISIYLVYEMVKSPNLSSFFINGLLSVIFVNLCGLTRSNGMLLGGFYLFFAMNFTIEIISNRKNKETVNNILKVVALIVFLLLSFVSYSSFQFYGYQEYCIPEDKERPVWCEKKLPMLYSFVQKEYWGNGFLAYYQFHQIPNFILSLPIITLSCYSVFSYFRKVGIVNFFTVFIFVRDRKKIVTLIWLYPFYVYFLFILFYGVFLMHIQVLTRFICSSQPALFWSISEVVTDDHNKKKKNFGWFSKYYFFYILVYNILGTILFCNFYPWT